MQNKKKILIVDDIEINRVILSEIFKEDYEILEAADGRQALEMIGDDQNISAVLLDLLMPEMNGLEVLREMNRRYDREKYLSLIEYARRVMPDVTFTSDVIVGFPGETYEEFQDTLSLI